MKQLDFNTMNNLADSDIWEKMTEKAQKSIKSMQVSVPQVDIPSHVALPVFQRQEGVQYAIALDGEPKGPYTSEQLRDMLKNDDISPETYVWTNGWPAWKMLKDCPQIMVVG